MIAPTPATGPSNDRTSGSWNCSNASTSRSYTAPQRLHQLTSEAGSPKPNGGNDPALSVGQVDNAPNGANAGEKIDPTPASKQAGDSDPANQHDNPQNTPSARSSIGAPNNSPAASGSGDDNNGAAPGLGLNFGPQDSPYSVNEGTTDSPLPYESVVLASPIPLVVGGSTIEKAPDGEAVIRKSTYQEGYQGRMFSSRVSVGVDVVLVGTITYTFPTSTPILKDGPSMVKAANGGVIIGTSIYPPGSQAQVSHKLSSVGISSIVVDGISYAIPAPSSVSKFLLDTSPISRASDGGAIFEGGTIGLGSQSSTNGHAISVGASTIVLDRTPYALLSSAGATL